MFYYAPTSRCKICSLATMRRTRVAFSSRPLMTVVNYLSHHMLYCITEDKYNVISSLSSYVIHWFKKTSYRGSCKLFSFVPSFHLGTSHLYQLKRPTRVQMALTGIWCAFVLVCVSLCQTGKVDSFGGSSDLKLGHQDKPTWLETLQDKQVRSMVFCSYSFKVSEN